jgi:hypothetical protein
MPTTIKLKNSVTTTNAPSSLAQGEVAINVTDKKVWVGNAATTPVQLLGTGADGSFTNLAYTGTLTGGTGVVNLGSGQFYKDSSGNIGVGTNNPTQKVHISGSTSQTLLITSTTGDVRIALDNTGAFYSWIDSYRASGAMVFATNNAEQMRITSTGNIGIGTINPTVKLDIAGEISFGSANKFTSSSNVLAGASGQNGILIRSAVSTEATPSYSSVDDTNTGMFFPAADTLAFSEGGTEAMRINSSGNLGIGTQSPNYKLEVNGAAQFDGYARITSAGGAQRLLIGNQDSIGTNKPSVISAGNSNIVFGYGNSWSTNGGTVTSLFSINTTGTSNDFAAVLTGGTTLYPAFFARAFVAVNQQGSQAILSSGNVSSIADGGTGLTTVNLTTAMPDQNYALVGGESGSGVISGTTIELNRSGTSQFGIRSLGSTNATAYDFNYVCVTLMR